MTSGLTWSGGRVGRHRPRPWLCGRRIVLACAGPEVPPVVALARDLRVTADIVRTWQRRFLAERLDGLVDEPRPGRPPTISVDQVEVVVVTTLEQLPKNATHWSPTSMA
ncbi:helix-turn-helix domain-containing protein [Streptomyces violaceus]|uniref:helix-turn-helix domain-containing protein n=1 Tax=Streptomyces violaceus TaxID=1936 RepID=UPI003805E270